MKYSAIIADVDLKHLSAVREIIVDNCSRIEVIAELTNSSDLVTIMNSKMPDILLIDCTLGQKPVFELFAQLVKKPLIIFITAEEQYAIEAFRINALDFLLKPIEKNSLVKALSKAVTQLDCEHHNSTTSLKMKILVVSSLSQYDIIKIDEIISVSSEGRCTVFVTIDNQKIVSYKNLSEYDFLVVNHTCFFKISRSNIINFKFLKKVVKGSGLYCELSNGEKFPVSRRRANDFKVMLSTFQ